MNFADKIAKLCLNKYASLKKTGKPCENEWTVLAGIVLKNSNDELKVVSLATGTKCLGANELTDTSLFQVGSRLSDSHAEVLARRALIRYLYDQIDQLLSFAKSDVLILNEHKKIDFKAGVSFHFYCSQSPCGDCSIIPKSELNADNRDYPPIKKLKQDDHGKAVKKNCIDNGEDEEKNVEFIEDIHRTGAKCTKTDVNQDPYLSGMKYHVTGPLRTKPGRGDPTLSMSCSDKLAKWNFIGVQGALLSLLIPVLKFDSIVIGNGCPFSLESMERGLSKRFGCCKLSVNIYRSSLSFVYRKNETRTHPCPSSVIWCAVQRRDTEITVEGRKQGATKNKKGSALCITRRALFETFLKIIDKHPSFKNLSSHPKRIYYYHCKQWSNEYQKSWKHRKSTILKNWTIKPLHFQYFSL